MLLLAAGISGNGARRRCREPKQQTGVEGGGEHVLLLIHSGENVACVAWRFYWGGTRANKRNNDYQI